MRAYDIEPEDTTLPTVTAPDTLYAAYDPATSDLLGIYATQAEAAQAVALVANLGYRLAA